MDLSDLASTAPGKGAALVGFLPPGLNSAEQTLEQKISNKINLFDFVSPSEWAAIRNFTTTYDATGAVQAAYAYAKTIRGNVEIPSGLFLIS